jgi:hypothetical protein
MIAPGDVVMADVRSSYRRDGSSHLHPCAVVEVARDGRTVRLARMTTNRLYSDGRPREPVPAWQRTGLRYPSFWWSSTTVMVPLVDVHDVIGRLPAAAWASLLALHGVPEAA